MPPAAIFKVALWLQKHHLSGFKQTKQRSRLTVSVRTPRLVWSRDAGIRGVQALLLSPVPGSERCLSSPALPLVVTRRLPRHQESPPQQKEVHQGDF